MNGRIRAGTCSWTDPTMVRSWYPASAKTAAERLHHYSALFDTVEVDSSFYGMPTPAMATAWAERTPPGFTFHIKAFGMMTRHGVQPDRLPPLLRAAHRFELDRYGRIVHPSPELREDVFATFASALEPLRAQGKLGLVLMQFPPYFTAGEGNRDYVSHSVRLLAPLRAAVGPDTPRGSKRTKVPEPWSCWIDWGRLTCVWTSRGWRQPTCSRHSRH